MGLESRLFEFLNKYPEILKVRGGYTTKKSKKIVTLPSSFTEDLCRVIGIIHGDGNMSNKRILITDKNPQYHLYLRKLFKKTFAIELNLFEDKNRNTFYSHSKNSILYKYLNDVLEVPSGAVRKSLTLPKYLTKLPIRMQAQYVAGIFDSESHIRKRQAEIDFSTTTKDLWVFVKSFLSKIGIKFTARIRRRRKNPEYEIFIYGKRNLMIFKKYVKLKNPDKKIALTAFLRH